MTGSADSATTAESDPGSGGSGPDGSRSDGSGSDGSGSGGGGGGVLDGFGSAHGFLLVVGLLLWAAALSIAIEGLPLTVAVSGKTLVRVGAVLLGMFALAAAFLLWPDLDERRRTMLTGGVVVFGLLLGGLVAQADPRVPDVRGLTEQNAINILDQLGISGSPIPVASLERDGEVIGQSPDGGTRARAVTLHIAARQAPPLPNVRGFADAQARLVFDDLGVEVTTVPVDGSPAGIVVDMLPEARERSLTVQLFVATGTEAPEMVDAGGMTVEATTGQLEDRGIAVTIVERESNERRGTVIDQDPQPGEPTRAATLVVSAGPGAPVIADVVSETESVAVERLEADGVAVTVRRQPSDEVPVGIVVAVEPDPGQRSRQATLAVSSGPVAASFIGDWTTVDPEADGLMRLVVTGGAGSDDELAVRGFAACTPDPCDWGQTTAVVRQGQLVGVFDFDFKTVEVRLERAGPLLAVTAEHHYVDDDRGSDRRVSITMSLGPIGGITAAELAVIANAEVLDVVLASGAVDDVPLLGSVALADRTAARLVARPGS